MKLAKGIGIGVAAAMATSVLVTGAALSAGIIIRQTKILKNKLNNIG